MKIKAKAIFDAAGIDCAYVSILDDGMERRLEAKLAYITKTNVTKAHQASPSDSDNDPDVKHGSAIGLRIEPDMGAQGQLVEAGEKSNFVLVIDGQDYSLTGSGMLDLRNKLISMKTEGQSLSKDQNNALDGINEIFDMVASIPDKKRFPAHLIAQAYHAAMIDNFGDVELPISQDKFADKSRADLLRARIAEFQPNHPDAIGAAKPLHDFLSDAGVQIGPNGLGVNIRSDIAQNININDNDMNKAMRQVILKNDRMCREVFGAMTRTKIEELSAALVSLSDVDRLRTRKSSKKLTGKWVNHIKKKAMEIAQEAMPGYDFQSEIFSENGRDILLLSDEAGRKLDVAYLYSWPSADRIPVASIDDERMMNVSIEEVPDEQEIERLAGVLTQIKATHAMENNQDRVHFDEQDSP